MADRPAGSPMPPRRPLGPDDLAVPVPHQGAAKVGLVTLGKRPDGSWLMVMTADGKTREYELSARMVARLIKDGVAGIVG